MVVGPLEQGAEGDSYPLNEQEDPNFNVGGVRRTLPDSLQFEQIRSYMEATYPRPNGADADELDRYLALMPDRLTHAAMLMLGSAVDHTMPGVAFSAGVEVGTCDYGACIRPADRTTGVWVIAAGPPTPRAREFSWQPEVAAVVALSGAVAIDVDTRELIEPAIAYARSRGATAVVAWFAGDGAATSADAAVLSFPSRPSVTGPTLVQAARGAGVRAPGADVIEYYAAEGISTPAEARRRITEVAAYVGRFSAEV
ncbi:hypothetical protein [Corynebacterium liangguodongii]|uniref:Uncharacterized protein n=1 Tax=Corynebacterium liangguodongii TaxID=2079535 RepID=A0A2S0WBK6_9CORY|nr:hypothetical protein [Corynebacterium liangguodongii]AWB83149.1 hypothetical protein C3E79_00495 [Corynebacterium liangguodongii]PWB98743.1 hypothetical protein DF219_09955 [Corynebacterium liangguodongii]